MTTYPIENLFLKSTKFESATKVTRTETYFNLVVKTLVYFTHNSSCSSKYLKIKGSYWPNSYYFH